MSREDIVSLRQGGSDSTVILVIIPKYNDGATIGA
jgi:hypothetical protein